MKLIACLSILSLICVFWSSAPQGPATHSVPREHTVLEQSESTLSLTPDWWAWEVWAEWLCPRRCRKSWRELWLLLYKLRRWYHKRVRRRVRCALCALGRCGRRAWRWLRRLWQAWQEPIDESPSAKSSVENPRSSVSVQEAGLERPRSSLDVASAPTAVQETEEPEQPEKRGPGRPREIPTDHLCCPYEECSSYGVFGPHPDHDIIGAGTYTTDWGETRQMYECKVCRHTFSETAGTPFHHLKTPKEEVIHAYKDLAEGLGVRATARVNGVDKDTVLRWVKRAGQHCQRVSEYMMQGLELTQVQLDELWTFVRKKQRQLSEWEKEHTEYGDNWIWTAFDPVHKLVAAVLVGERTEEEAKGLLGLLKERLAAGSLPLFISDSLAHYAKAILHVFGKWIQPERKGDRGRFPKPRPVAQEGLHYATVHKEREKGHVVSVTTEVIYGTWEDIRARLKELGQTISTSYVERENLTLRHLVSRLHRKTLCFSKKREYLEYHLHLVLAYYHFVLYHSSLRERLPEPIPTRGDGSPKIWRQQTPAMSAGLTDHQWTMEELLMYQVPAGP